MSLRLILNQRHIEPGRRTKRGLSLGQIALIASVGFLILKLPMVFVTHNPEELRDFDHFLRAAAGQIAYRDYTWIYGPLNPLVFGVLYKIFPAKLVVARLFNLVIWAFGGAYLGLIFSRYFQSKRNIFLGVLFASACFGYPSYSLNHVLPAVAGLACVYHLLVALESGGYTDFNRSFAALMVCFFARPVLAGYGAFVAWTFLYCYFVRGNSKYSRLIAYFLTGVGLFALFFAIYGSAIRMGFLPPTWTVLQPKGYPNLGYLVPKEGLFLKSLRAALETFTFYAHYFIWPAIMATVAVLFKSRRELRAAAIIALFGWSLSLDLLHYGFNDPLNEQAMWVRGQYFFALTAVSIFLVAWPALYRLDMPFRRFLAGGAILAIGFWAHLPYVHGIWHLASLPTNNYGFAALTGIKMHPDRKGVLEAIQFINSRCARTDFVVVPQYDPGLNRLLYCKVLFDRDAYLFTRAPAYSLSANETPYAPNGGVTNDQLIQRGFTEGQPSFYLVQGDTAYAPGCSAPGWAVRIFGSGANARRVCYKL